MPFIPRNERPSLALLAGLEEEQASELSGALSTAADEIDGEQLVRHVIDRTPSMEARDVKRVLKRCVKSPAPEKRWKRSRRRS